LVVGWRVAISYTEAVGRLTTRGVQMSPPPPLPETADPSGDEEVTPFEGLTEDDDTGFPQPVALGEHEDPDPGADPGEVLPGEEGESP
jgi:hypothetical protein